jgi:hypothetical protein
VITLIKLRKPFRTAATVEGTPGFEVTRTAHPNWDVICFNVLEEYDAPGLLVATTNNALFDRILASWPRMGTPTDTRLVERSWLRRWLFAFLGQ